MESADRVMSRFPMPGSKHCPGPASAYAALSRALQEWIVQLLAWTQERTAHCQPTEKPLLLARSRTFRASLCAGCIRRYQLQPSTKEAGPCASAASTRVGSDPN